MTVKHRETSLCTTGLAGLDRQMSNERMLPEHPADCRLCRGTGMVCEDHPGFPFGGPWCGCDAPGKPCRGESGADIERRPAKAIEFADYAVKRARAGDFDVIHTMTEGLDRDGLRAVIATLSCAYAFATPQTADVWAALTAQDPSVDDVRRSA